jgi:hypothetical protein
MLWTLVNIVAHVFDYALATFVVLFVAALFFSVRDHA